jgi:calcium channel MID1
MQQIACNTTDSARYSLAADCANCTAAYKNWLCAVAIPRCEDISLPILRSFLDGTTDAARTQVNQVFNSKALMPRNLGQAFPNGTTLPSLLSSSSSSSSNNTTDDDTSVPQWNSTGYENITSRVYANSSRNPVIDSAIKPGPYMEFLPCEDLCFSLVRMCPAAMGFACPQGNGLARSYGRQGQCNNPGSVFVQSAAVRGGVSLSTLMVVAVGSVAFGLFS